MGSTRLARLFYSGLYAKVIATTVDAKGGRVEDADLAFVVGALTFVGRVSDAQMCFDGFRRRAFAPDRRTMTASRFFLGVAEARAGNFTRARELLTQPAGAYSASGDAWSAAFAFQGLACLRYFTGRYKDAARQALLALREAQSANVPYAKMLSTDLRGHALVQLGHLHAGIALLEQARSFARHLGFGLNAYAIECSMATYSAKFMVGDEVVSNLERLISHGSHDAYSQHALGNALAIQLSLRGRRHEAMEALERAELHLLKIDARRAKVTSLLARLHVTRWSQGPAACDPLLRQSEEFLEQSDVTFRSEFLGFEVLVARAFGDAPRLGRAEKRLARLARSGEAYLAKAALSQFGVEPIGTSPFAEDRLTPLLYAVATGDQSVVLRLLSQCLLGAIPEVLGLVPSRRILILPAENTLLLEDHGEVILRTNPPRWCPELLRVLSQGDVSKEALVSKLWGIRRYHPERHDPMLRTTIHRLRTYLGGREAWVRVTNSGYGTTVPVLFCGAGFGENAEPFESATPPLAEGELPLLQPPAVRSQGAEIPQAAQQSLHDRLCDELARRGPLTSRRLAHDLEASDSTVLRALRNLIAHKRVVRTGFARATRYLVHDG